MWRRVQFWLIFLTVVVLGISVGAMLGEQQTLVPFWMEMKPEAFYGWYAKNASRLKGFFAPWQIAGAVLALLSVISCRIQKHPGVLWFGASTVFSFAVLATFFLFFKEMNGSFVAQSIPASKLPDALAQWSTWQCGRITVGFIAFCTALYGLSQHKESENI